jgi:hypothetical protein
LLDLIKAMRYLKIKSIAEEIVNGLLKDQGALITSAITAVVQAS